MQESFLAGRPFHLFFLVLDYRVHTNKFLETLHWKRSAESAVIV